MHRPHVIHRQLLGSDSNPIEFWTGDGWSFVPQHAKLISGYDAIGKIAEFMSNRVYSHAVVPTG